MTEQTEKKHWWDMTVEEKRAITTKMNPDVKEKWLTALRSGEYQQTTGVLNRGNKSFCCLGVLTDLHMKEQGGEWLVRPHDKQIDLPIEECALGVRTTNTVNGVQHTVLPPQVMEWAGLESDVPNVVMDDGGTRGLASLNDDGASFAELAELIEVNL